MLNLLFVFAASLNPGASSAQVVTLEAKFRDVLVCKPESIDPAYQGSSFVKILQEVDEEGVPIEGARLRVVTYDQFKEPFRYYFTHLGEVSRAGSRLVLDIWRYEYGAEKNKKIGKLVWSFSSQSGVLQDLSLHGEIEELALKPCSFKT